MKKMLAILMAVMMAVLPVLGMAGDIDADMLAALKSGKAIVVESTAEAGEGMTAMLTGLGAPEEIVTAISELIKLLKISCYLQNGQAGLAVKASDANILDADMAIDKDKQEVYIASNLLGDSVLRLNQDDLMAAQKYENFAGYDWQAANGIITAEEAQTLKDTYEPVTNDIPMPDFSAVDFSELTMENTMMIIMTAMQKVNMEMTEDGGVKVTMTVTGEDSLELYKALAADLKASPSLMKAMDDYLTQVEAPFTMEALLDALTQTLETSIQSTNVTVTVEANVSAEGNVTAAMVISNGSEQVRIDFALSQGENTAMSLAITVPDGSALTFSMAMGPYDNMEVVYAEFAAMNSDGARVAAVEVYAATSEEADAFEGKLIVSEAELLTVEGVVTKDHSNDDVWVDVLDMDITVNMGEEQTISEQIRETVTMTFGAAPEVVTESVMYMNGSEEPWATSTTRMYTVDAMPAVNTQGAVAFADMDQAAFEAWTAEAAQNALMNLLTSLMQNLPESVMNLLMGQM